MSGPEASQLRYAIGELRQCVGSLRSRYGDSAVVRRLANDIERLDIDAGEVVDAMAHPHPGVPRSRRGSVYWFSTSRTIQISGKAPTMRELVATTSMSSEWVNR